MVVAEGDTDLVPTDPTGPIPGVIDTDVALETFQVKVDEPTIKLGGVAKNELITGRPIMVNTATWVTAVTGPAALVAVKT
jgi:hypothetical protein